MAGAGGERGSVARADAVQVHRARREKARGEVNKTGLDHAEHITSVNKTAHITLHHIYICMCEWCIYSSK